MKIHPESQLASSDLEEKVPPRRRLRLGLASWLALGMVSLVFLHYFLAKDEPPPDLSDLQIPQFPPIRDSEDGYKLLVSAAQTLHKNKAWSEWWETREGDLVEFRNKSGVFKGDADVLLNEILDKVDSLAPKLWRDVSAATAIPAALSEKPLAWDDDAMPRLDPLRLLAQLLGAKAAIEAWRGDTAACVQTLDTAFRVCAISERNSISLIHLLTTIGMRGILFLTLRDLVATTPFSDDELRQLQVITGAARTQNENIALAYMGEVFFFGTAVTLENAGRLLQQSDQLVGMGLESTRVDRKTRALHMLFPRLAFKPNKTRRLHAEHIRAILSLIGKTGLEIKNSRRLDCPWDDHPALLENRFGEKVLLDLHTMDGPLRTIHRVESNISVTEAFIALRRHSLRHDGALPTTLDELTPEFIPALPIDHADGLAIRYSREYRALWSIGLNNLTVTAKDQKQQFGEVLFHLPATF